MRKIGVARRFIAGLILFSILSVICSQHLGQADQLAKTNIPNKRSKRGLVLLVPYDSNEASSSSNENADPSELEPLTNLPADEADLGPSDPSKVFMRHSSMLDSREAENPYVRMRSVSSPREIARRLAEARKSKRHASESPLAIILGRKINRPRGTRRKKYACYCRETARPVRRSLRPRAHAELAWASAEEPDPPYDPNQEHRPKVARKADPTKFSIPFARNVNFDQRLVLGLADQERRKYRIYPLYPLYPLARPGQVPPQPVYRYDPYAQTQPRQQDRAGPTDRKVMLAESYADECVGMYGKDVCATLATVSSSDVDLDSSDESLEDFSREDDKEDDDEGQLGGTADSPKSLENLNRDRVSLNYPTQRSYLESSTQRLENYKNSVPITESSLDKPADKFRAGNTHLPDYSSRKSVINIDYGADVEVQKSASGSPIDEQNVPTSFSGQSNEDFNRNNGQSIKSTFVPYPKTTSNNLESISFVKNPTYETLKPYNLQKGKADSNYKEINENSNFEFRSTQSTLYEPTGGITFARTKKYSKPPYNDTSESSSQNTTLRNYENPKKPNENRPTSTITSIMHKNSKSTESLIQSVDERPSTAYENNSKKFDVKLRSQINSHENLENRSKHNTSEALLQNAIKKVINNFVPGKAQDLLANLGDGNLPTFTASMEELLPEILDTPILKNLLSDPEVQDMIIAAAGNFLIELTGSSDSDEISRSIKKALCDIIDQIPHPHPTAAPMTADAQGYSDGQWVRKRMASLERSKAVTTVNPPKEVFDKIESIINRSAVGEHIATHPVIQNLVVKTVKHSLDKEHGAIDEFTIRQAFDLLVRAKPTITRRTVDPDDYEASSTQDSSALTKSPKNTADPVEKEPTKYYSPNDMILEYIKTHRSTLNPITASTSTNIGPGNAGTLENLTTVKTVRQTYPSTSGSASMQASKKINLSLEPRDGSSQPTVKTIPDTTSYNQPATHSDNPAASNPTYLGRLLPEEEGKAGNLAELQNSRLMYVGDGVRLPVTVKRLGDGSLALTLSEEGCKRFADEKCPCCLPAGGNGLIVRERRSDEIIHKLSFTDDEVAEKEELQGPSEDRVKYRGSTAVGSKTKKATLAEHGIGGRSVKENKISASKVRMSQDNVHDKRYVETDNNYDDQENSLINTLKKIRNQHNGYVDGPPYRYQRYASERTNAVRDVLYWVKNLLINGSSHKA